MDATEKLLKEQSEMPDEVLIDEVEKLIDKLCITGGKSFRMCVPVEITDSDMLLSELVRRHKENVDFFEWLFKRIEKGDSAKEILRILKLNKDKFKKSCMQ